MLRHRAKPDRLGFRHATKRMDGGIPHGVQSGDRCGGGRGSLSRSDARADSRGGLQMAGLSMCRSGPRRGRCGRKTLCVARPRTCLKARQRADFPLSDTEQLPQRPNPPKIPPGRYMEALDGLKKSPACAPAKGAAGQRSFFRNSVFFSIPVRISAFAKSPGRICSTLFRLPRQPCPFQIHPESNP